MVLVKCKLSNGSYAKILRILHVISTVIAKITMRGRPFFYETNLGHILIVVVKKLYLVDRHRYNHWAADCTVLETYHQPYRPLYNNFSTHLCITN